MRILITTIAHYCDRPSGSAKIAFEEAQELARRGEDVWVLAAGDPALPEYERKDGIHFLRYVPAKASRLNSARGYMHQKAATKVLSRHLPKVDVTHGHIPLTGLAALEFYGNHVPSGYTIHSPAKMELAIEWRHSGLLRRIASPVGLAMIERIERECLRRSRVVTALSQYTIDCIGRIHGKKLANAVKLIPGWVDTRRFSVIEDRNHAKAALGWPTDCPVLFTLRRLVPRMGLDRLLDAAHELLESGLKFHLMLGGSGPLRSKLEEQAAKLGIAHCVTFLGNVEDRLLALAYGACDAFVLPTAELECFGIIALEALAAGRPVLATPVGAIPEIVGRFERTWLARSSETADIANLLREFLAGKLPGRWPAELHREVSRQYGREIVLQKLIETAIAQGKGIQVVNSSE